jgi:essential nuclear protein 1
VDTDLIYSEKEDLMLNNLREVDSTEDDLIQKFLHDDKSRSRTLADIIMEKLREKEVQGSQLESSRGEPASVIPSKVVEVYTAVGNMLRHYKSGKLPKALKMLPHLKNWEQILWLTRPDMWSPIATYALTRIFVSNLKVKMAQRFFNLVLLEKCRDDISSHDKLNYHLYLALKKALFKPAAFYKGVLLPLAQSGTCTLREATIIGSVLMKVSIPAIHSAAALLRLAEMQYSGSTSVFIKILLNKKYALPSRVIDALVAHFAAFAAEKRALPVIWHQSLLMFVQRYKLELGNAHTETILQLVKLQQHHEITVEVRREIISARMEKRDQGDVVHNFNNPTD